MAVTEGVIAFAVEAAVGFLVERARMQAMRGGELVAAGYEEHWRSPK